VVFSPDGNRLAAACYEAVKLWDAATGRELLTMRDRMAGTLVDDNPWEPASLIFDPQAKTLAAVDQNAVYVFDARTGRKISESEFQRGNELSSETGTRFVVAFSPDGKAIATLVRGIVLLNDAGTGKQLLKLPASANSSYVSFAMSPNGAHLVTGDENGRVKLWDVATGRELHSFQAGNDKGRVSSLAFSPDEKRLLGSAEFGAIRVWNTFTGEELLTLRNRSDLTWKPDQPGVLDFTTADDFISGVTFSPDGKRLAVAADRQVHLYTTDIAELLDLARLRLTRPIPLTREECQQYLHVTPCPAF